MPLRYSRVVGIACLCWAWSLGARANAQGISPRPTPATGSPSSAPIVQTTPSSRGVLQPKQGTDDWIQLTSGEWLRGTIERMRDDKLEFDSKELNLQTFDWGDVAEVHSSRPHTVVFEDLTLLC